MMKLIIDIDDKTYADIKKGIIYSSVRDVPQESVVAIANGTPLDDIKAEIQNITPKATIRYGKTNIDSALMIPLDKVLEILDKHIGERSTDEDSN